jgi:hypothetical protein
MRAVMTRRRSRRFVLAEAAGAVGALMVAVATAPVGAGPGQLAEHPIVGALTHPAIAYATRPTDDPVATLNRGIEDGSVRLEFDESTGYLGSVLAALRVPVESQMLVMSKTGVQALYTDPANPRAIYFNDAVTVGYIPGAPLLELAVHDRQQGVLFYVLDQKPQSRPLFDRRQGCLSCHHGYTTLHVPGMVTRSVFIAPDGLPLTQFGSYDPDDRTPFRLRWGGWYVTGTHGSMRHMGNAIVSDPANRDAMISERTLNRMSLAGAFDERRYPSTHSDIAALMVFQHQVRMTNLITRVGWDARVAAYDHRLDLSTGPLKDAVNELVDSLLFAEEEPLTDTVKGTSGFAQLFAAQGPSDRAGHSLRQLDLGRRLLRYPCSYMVYSPAFAALPSDVRGAIYSRMGEILTGRETQPKYARSGEADRRAVVEILRDTLPDFPREFGKSAAAH